ncbi:MAG: hypothetical protein K9K86_06890 [Pseudomonadales bacterium]|nr:hypothetical protein [Pseudomonadales bacterium]
MSTNTKVTEIVKDFYRISTFIPEVNMQFNQFLVVDDEPLLFHTGMNALFSAVHSAVGLVINPSKIRWISFSHFEADECGSLNQWLAEAPSAQATCSLIGSLVSVNDFAIRPAVSREDGERFNTGNYQFQFCATPQVPHAWDAGLLIEETQKVLFCSDLLHQMGNVEPIIEDTVIVERFKQTLDGYDKGPFAHYLPYTRHTQNTLERLAALEPKVLLPMHGSAYIGDGRRVLLETAEMMKATLDKPL